MSTAAARGTPSASAKKQPQPQTQTQPQTQPLPLSPRAVASTPQQKARTPSRAKNTFSPQSECGGETPQFQVRKAKVTFKGAARTNPNRASFLAPTQATAVKRRMKASLDVLVQPLESALSNRDSTKALTVPVSPSFAVRNATGTKSAALTSEDLLLQRLDREREEEACRAHKNRRLYKSLKAKATLQRRGSKVFTSRSGSAVKAAKTKARNRFTQPKQIGFVGHSSTVSLPCRLHGKSGGGGAQALESKSTAAAPKKGPTGLTLVEPFKFATNKRFAVDAAAHAQAKQTAVVTGAEQAQNFMRDARSHGVRCSHYPLSTVFTTPYPCIHYPLSSFCLLSFPRQSTPPFPNT
jgi:hypothetical protein